MKFTIAAFCAFLSLASFASSTDFNSLECSVNQQGRDIPVLTLNFNSTVNAINNSGLINTLLAEMEIKGSAETIPVKLGQYTRTNGYEIQFNGKILGSDYNTFIILQPTLRGSKLENFTGAIELNMVRNGVDDMVVKSEQLICRPVI